MCVSVRSSSGRAARLLWSRRPQEGLWPRGSAFYGAAERTQLAAVVTHTPQRGPGPGHPSLFPPAPTREWAGYGPGAAAWQPSGGSGTPRLSCARAASHKAPPGAGELRPGMAGKVTGVFPRTQLARGGLPASFPLLQLPSRHMARRPRPGSGAGRQTATAGLLLPARQEGTRRAGWLLHAPACAPGVSPRSRALPERPSPCLAGGLGLKPGFLGLLGPPSLPPPAVGRKGQQWEAGPALAPAGGPAAAGWDGGELSCPVTWPRGQGGHGLTHAEPLRAPGEEEEEQDAGMRLPSGLTCLCPAPASSWGGGSVLASLAGTGRGAREAVSAGPRFPPPPPLLSQVLAQREPWQLENSPDPTAALGFGEGRRQRGAAPPPRQPGDPRGRAGGFSQLLQRCWRDLLARGGNQIPCPAAGGARGPAPRRADPPQTLCRGAGPGLCPSVRRLGSSV